MKIDKFDLKILAALQADGRLPTVRLAEHGGLTSSPSYLVTKGCQAVPWHASRRAARRR